MDRTVTESRAAQPAETPRDGRVQSLDRAFELLDLMAAAGGEMALSRLAAASGLPVPTIHRIMRTLVGSGHVLQLPSRRYALGPRLIGLGDAASRTLDAWAMPYLSALAEQTGETANMAMLDGHMVVYIAQVPSSRHTMRMFTEVGRRVHAHCTGVGKALLARLPENEARGIVEAAGMPARTERTITTTSDLLAELREIRARGYAVDDGEHEDGVRCVAVVVPGTRTTTISVSGPASRVTREAVADLVPLLVATADGLSERRSNRDKGRP